MVASTNFAVFFALLSVVSSELNLYSDETCKFELFNDDSSGFDGPTLEVDWTQSFIRNQMFKGKTLDDIYSNPLLVKELQIKVQNTINEYTLAAEKNVRCAKILADKILDTMIKGKHVTNLDITGNVEIDGLKIKAKNVYEVFLNNGIESEPFGNVGRLYITGKTVEKVLSRSTNSTDNTIIANYVSDVQIFSENILGTTIHAKHGAYKFRLFGESVVDDLQVESFHVDGVQVTGSESRNIRINGTVVTDVVLIGQSSINNMNIEGKMLMDIMVGSTGIMDNVVIKADTVKRLAIGATEAMGDVNIIVSESIDDLNVSIESSDVKNFKLNGIDIDLEGRFKEMQCADKLGYPDDDAELGGEKKCSSDYCQSMCSTSGHETGKCFDRTCCCMK